MNLTDGMEMECEGSENDPSLFFNLSTQKMLNRTFEIIKCIIFIFLLNNFLHEIGFAFLEGQLSKRNNTQ